MSRSSAGRRGEPPEAPEDVGADAPAEWTFHDRDLSWISFNERVLQEAADPSVPLHERLHFLSIFSSNLDEFFRVRVASLRSLLRLKKKKIRRLGIHPARLLREIHSTVSAQQERFGGIIRGQVLPALAEHGVMLVNDRQVSPEGRRRALEHFHSEVRRLVEPVLLERGDEPPFLRNRGIYLVVELWPEATSEHPDYALTEIPSPPLDRFLVVSEGHDGLREVMYLDDVLRLGLPDLFPDQEVGRTFAVKLTRDAELYLEDEFEGDLVEAVRKSLGKRETGVPSRFLYDLESPYSVISFLKDCLGLEEEDLVVGGHYHNLSDFAHFPRVGGPELSYPERPPLPHPGLEGRASLLEAVAERDRLLHFPYQSYNYVVRFFEEAAEDPAVEELGITVYRVAPDSAILEALSEAAGRGKRVRVFFEVQARFDEAANLEWAERLEAAGVETHYSIPGLKVHTKLALAVRREGEARRVYASVGTGNFNERTARFYTDHALLTADPRLTGEVERVFAFLMREIEDPEFAHLLVAPFQLRERLYGMIDGQAERARSGGPARIFAKMNGLEDEEVLERLYEASRAGVEIRLIVRGICRLVAGVPGQSENIEVRSIVDRYLEHSRIYAFGPDGEEDVFIASADWMTRNLSRRVEVAAPIYDVEARRQLLDVLRIQWADDTRARRVDCRLRNEYVDSELEERVRAQETIREMLEEMAGMDGARLS